MNIRNFDYNLLRLFRTVYETGSVKKTAERLNVTQPAISIALQRLNDALNEKLFVRTKVGMTPTNVAREFYAKVVPAMATIDESLSTFVEFEPATSNFNFKCAFSSYLDFFMPDMVDSIQQQAPHISIERIRFDFARNVAQLNTNELDFLISSNIPDNPNIQGTKLFDDYLVLVCRKQHPLLGKKLKGAPSASLIEADQAMLTHGLADKSVITNHIQLAKVQFGNLFPLIHFVASGQHVAVATKKTVSIMQQYYPIEYVEGSWSECPIPIYLLHSPHVVSNPAYNWFCKIITDHFKE